jgi:hypothetical protein
MPVMEGVTGSNAAKIATIAWHTATLLTQKEAPDALL